MRAPRELRRTRRRPIEDRVVVTWEDDGRAFEVRGSCRDISDTGVGLFSKDLVPTGSYVGIRNRLSGLRRSGVVRHTTRVGTGYRLGVEALKQMEFRHL